MIMTEEEMDEQIELMQKETNYQYVDEETEEMNEKELFDALAENCPNELKKHDAKVREEAIEEYKRNFNNEFPINYHSTKPYFTLENVRITLVDGVAREMEE